MSATVRSGSRARIPLIVVTGFLGAGKTTLLKRLLASPALAGSLVLVNEFGEAGLDDRLLSGSATVIGLLSGCVCCTVRGEFSATLEELLRDIDNGRRGAPDRVIVETTGLASPAPIIATVIGHPYLRLRFLAAGVITVVAANAFLETAIEMREAVEQVALADLIVISKTDLAPSDGRLSTAIEAINAEAPIVTTADGDSALAALLQKPAPTARGQFLSLAVPPKEVSHAKRFDSFTLDVPEPIGADALTRFLNHLAERFGTRLLRLKGLVTLREEAGRPSVVQAVQGAYDIGGRLPSWPPGARGALTLIGRELPEAEIRQLFAAAVGAAQPDTPDAAAAFDNPLVMPWRRRSLDG
ncbi:MAG: GTP-binding protein [Bauldia sp.]